MNILIVGASGGIGRALEAAARSRYPAARVLGASRRDHHLVVDLARGDSIEALAGQLASEVKTLDWVLCAGGTLHGPHWAPEKQLKELDGPAMEAVMAVNAVAPMLLARSLMPLLSHSRPAVFAALGARVGSISDNHRGGWYSYRMSKAALAMGIRTLAIECRRRAPRLTCVALHPGTVDTPLSAPFQRNVPPEQLFTPAQSADYLLKVIEGLQPEHSGQHLAWDGSQIPA